MLSLASMFCSQLVCGISAWSAVSWVVILCNFLIFWKKFYIYRTCICPWIGLFQKLSLPPHGRFFVLTSYPLRISIPEGFVKTPLLITMPPSGKKARLEPRLPLKILATEPLPSRVEFLMPFHWRGHNRYFLELHISLKTLTVSNFWRFRIQNFQQAALPFYIGVLPSICLV